MSITIESDDDKSVKDLEKRRYYHHQYSLKLKGYLLDECRFEAVKSVSDVSLPISECAAPNNRACTYDIHKNVLQDGSCETMYKVMFQQGETDFDFTIAEDITFTYDNQKTGNIVYQVNGVVVEFPFQVDKGDSLSVSHGFDTKKTVVVKIYSYL
jgi:hypothetical protein